MCQLLLAVSEPLFCAELVNAPRENTLILAIFIYGANSRPTRLELKQFSMLRRSVPKMVLSLSKGEHA